MRRWETYSYAFVAEDGFEGREGTLVYRALDVAVRDGVG